MPVAMSADPVTAALKFLALADRQGVKALKFLGKVLGIDLEVPHLVSCRFKVSGVRHHGRVTEEHRDLILNVVAQYPNDAQAVESFLLQLVALVDKAADAAIDLVNGALHGKKVKLLVPRSPEESAARTGACFFNNGTPCQAGLSFFVCSGLPGFDHWAAGQGCDGVMGKEKDKGK
jgi:hypothetical protein